MKIAKSNHYLVNTDMELVLSLVNQLEELGITNFNQLKEKITQLRITDFDDVLKYTTGPDCDQDIAIIIEELIDRLRFSKPDRESVFTSSNEVGTYLADKLVGRKQEEFWAIYIDNSNHIIAEKRIFVGTLDKTIAHPREVFRWAMIYACAGMFIVHNHPSGKLFPSQSDLMLTREMDKAAKLMKVRLLDHFIVGKGHYLSMKENELF